MTAPPFSNLQPGFQRKRPISLPTWILSVDGIFQIEYSHCCGFARRSSPGQATRTRRQLSLFHAPNTDKPVRGRSCRSKTCNDIFPPTLVLVWSWILYASLCHDLINPITQIVYGELLPYISTMKSVYIFSKGINQSFISDHFNVNCYPPPTL